MSISMDERIWGLSTIWKEAEYNFPFWMAVQDLDWDQSYRESIRNVIHLEDDRAYYLELMRFISLLNDGHTMVRPPEALYRSMGTLPLRMQYVQGQHVVIAADGDLPIKPGETILSIDHVPVDTCIQAKILPYMWHAKYESSLALLYDNMFGGSMFVFLTGGKPLLLETQRGQHVINPVHGAIHWNTLPQGKIREKVNLILSEPAMQLAQTGDGIAIVTIPSFMNPELPDIFYQQWETLAHAVGVVIDVRNNTGGNSSVANEIAQAFIDGA